MFLTVDSWMRENKSWWCVWITVKIYNGEIWWSNFLLWHIFFSFVSYLCYLSIFLCFSCFFIFFPSINEGIGSVVFKLCCLEPFKCLAEPSGDSERGSLQKGEGGSCLRFQMKQGLWGWTIWESWDWTKYHVPSDETVLVSYATLLSLHSWHQYH